MNKKWVLFVLFTILITSILLVDISQFLSLDFLRSQQKNFQIYYQSHPLRLMFIFCAIYIMMTSLCIPGANILTIFAGSLFGLIIGSLISSFCSAIGALISFQGSRWLFRDYVQKRFKKYVDPFNKGFAHNGLIYLFALRITPIVPFFIINLVMGITPIKPWAFYVVTQLGMLVSIVIYTNAGTHLGTIQSIEDILSAKIFFSLLALAILPLLLKRFSFVSHAVNHKPD